MAVRRRGRAQPFPFPNRVAGFYFVDADPPEAVTAARLFLGDAGFTVKVEWHPGDWCLPLDQQSIPPAEICPKQLDPPCTTYAEGETTCHFYASRGQECIAFLVRDRGEGMTYYRESESIVLSDPPPVVVRLTDHDPGPAGCYP